MKVTKAKKAKHKKVLTPQGMGRMQEKKRQDNERAEDFKLQKKGYRIEQIGPFKRVEDPKGGVTLEARAKSKKFKKQQRKYV